MQQEIEEKRKQKIDAKLARKDERGKLREELNQQYQEELARKTADPSAWEAERREEKKVQVTEFQEPPMLGLITRLFRGINFSVSNIHIRVEDDYYMSNKPYSFGFVIQKIVLETSAEEENRECQENSSTIVK